MRTAANRPVKPDRFHRRACAPTAAEVPRPPTAIAASPPPLRRRSAIPAGASRKPAVFAADGPRTPTGRRPLSRPNIPANARTPQCQHTITSRAAFRCRRSNFATFRRRPTRPAA